jgi:hypothetical protein
LSVAYGLRTAPGHHDFGAFLGELFRGRETDPASAASDDDNLVREAAHGVPPTICPHSYPVDQLRIGREALAGSGSLIEGNHLLHDKGQTVFYRKVTRVQPVHLRMGKILEIGFTALAREKDVILSPESDCLGLLLSEERLPLRVELYVCR